MRTIARVALATATLAVFALDPFGASADDDLKAKLTGFQEVPAISSAGSGSFRAHIEDDQQSITWKLEYDGLEGAVQQAHIHFGQKSVNGNIVVFLCTNLGSGPAGTAACPASGTVEGTATAGNMVDNAAATQGLAAGEFSELLRAIRRGVAYANVHTEKHPGGELRGQIKVDRDDD